ncbi:MAG TPA: hypothetical protein EYQ26_09395 [Rhodospirillales bacterium]|nr:hypothetical protein [Rhodospirillales bacterium]
MEWSDSFPISFQFSTRLVAVFAEKVESMCVRVASGNYFGPKSDLPSFHVQFPNGRCGRCDAAHHVRRATSCSMRVPLTWRQEPSSELQLLFRSPCE